MRRLLHIFLWRLTRLSSHPYTNIPLLWISGVGRSGTTALRMSLGQHFQVSYNFAENNIAFDILKLAHHNCTYPSRATSMQMRQERYNATFRKLLCEVLYPRPRWNLFPRYWMVSSDISPDLAIFLKDLFPNSRIVYIVRNGIEVVASRCLFPGFQHFSFEDNCREWARSVSMVHWGHHRSDFLLIRHERLTGDEACSSIRAVLEWLGLPNDPACCLALDQQYFHPTISGDSTDASLQFRHSRWKSWTEEQREQFVSICGEPMEFFRYPIPW